MSLLVVISIWQQLLKQINIRYAFYPAEQGYVHF
jgi:hypothetical protein